MGVRIPLRRGVLDTTLCDTICHLLSTGRWFSPGPPVSPTNKTDCHDITEILLKVVLNTIAQSQPLIIRGGIIELVVTHFKIAGKMYSVLSIFSAITDWFLLLIIRIDGVMVSVLASSVVDRGFKPGQVKPNTK